MHTIVWIMLGGAMGASMRYMVIRQIAMRIEHVFPWPTLIVNLTGSLIIGLLWGIFEAHEISHNVRNLIFIGILGSFTTFSSYSNEILLLLREHLYGPAFLNILLHNIGGISLAYLGYLTGKWGTENLFG